MGRARLMHATIGCVALTDTEAAQLTLLGATNGVRTGARSALPIPAPA